MMIQTNINADVARANLFHPIIIAEDDENSHRLIAQLQVSGEELVIDQSAAPSAINHVMLNYRRADGMIGAQNGTVMGGKVYFNIPDEMLELDDIVKCDISIAYPCTVVTHSLSVSDGEIVVTERTRNVQAPLRTALFYIDSQLRVITEYEGGEI
ncbi:MAG: hypothetical protein IJH07_05415 [Ruminococcus sp.]|nr:hypothetical protein [Ruminococcus sp.]